MEKIFKFPEVRQEEERGVATSIQKDQRPVGSRLCFPLDELYNCTSVDFSVCEMHFFYQQNGLAKTHLRAQFSEWFEVTQVYMFDKL